MSGTVEPGGLVQEVRDRRSRVDGRVVGLEGEEDVVEEGALEDEVDEEIEGVPDEEDAEAAGGGCVEDALGELVGAEQKASDGEEGHDCCLVDDWWGSCHGCGFGCGCGSD